MLYKDRNSNKKYFSEPNFQFFFLHPGLRKHLNRCRVIIIITFFPKGTEMKQSWFYIKSIH